MRNADFTGRGITDARIRPNELDLRLILDTIPGFVWTMTATGEVELVNRQMLDYFGATFAELKNWSSFLHEDDRARVIAEWTRTIETTEPYEIAHRLRRADGAYRWFQARGLALLFAVLPTDLPCATDHQDAKCHLGSPLIDREEGARPLHLANRLGTRAASPPT